MLKEDQLRNKIVLVRSDLSEVMFEKTLHTNRNLREAMSTIEYLLGMKAKIILATHMVIYSSFLGAQTFLFFWIN